MSDEIRALLEGLIVKFNDRAATDPKLGEELDGIRRKVMVDLTDGPKFNFLLADRRMSPLAEGSIDEPDLIIAANTATLLGLLKKEISPMKALALQKLKISGKTKLEDMMRLRKFF
jgi:putative sterol carrier protein